ncbi:MAG TPA: hypothetical protein VGD54_19210 [Steroidobacteraceae bacterium]
MHLGLNRLTLGITLAFGVAACGAAAAEEPSESQMKEAMLYAINHPPGITNSEPITIKSFKKEGCENPTPRGYSCGFDVIVASSNLGASMYNNISMAIFYKDKDTGKWVMRPPF